MIKNKLKLMLLTLLIVYAANSVHAGGNSHNEVIRLSVSRLLLGILMNMMVPNTGDEWQTLLSKYYREGNLLSFILLLGKEKMKEDNQPELLKDRVYQVCINLGEINYQFTNYLLSDIDNFSENGLLRSFGAHIESLDKSLQSKERETFLNGLKYLIWLLDPQELIKNLSDTDPDYFSSIILPNCSRVKEVVGWLKFLSTQFEVRSSNLG